MIFVMDMIIMINVTNITNQGYHNNQANYSTDFFIAQT